MGAIGVHHTDTSTGAWDGPKAQANLKNDGDEAYYRKAFAWQDPDGDSKTKAAYKFIHHEVNAGGDIGAANVKACQTAIGVLNGGRGGADIPDSDREGVYRHVAAHLKDADLEPAELKRSGREMPVPQAGQTQKEFIDMCMGDGVMNDEYPDNNQRYAVCMAQWDKEKKSASPEIERRCYRMTDLKVELRTAGEQKKPVITGYAAVFNQLSEDLGGFLGDSFREKVVPGAFAKTIKSDDIRALWNHDANHVLGRTKSGTLRLAEDEKGLRIEIDPPETQTARDLMELIRRGDVDQMSFGFFTVKDQWEKIDNKSQERTLVEVKLLDISPVTFPAYPQTSVAVDGRSLAQQLRQVLDERLPRKEASDGRGAHEDGRVDHLALRQKALDLSK